MFKNIIFDWTGVIKDGNESQLWIVNKMFKTAGLPGISLEEMKENWEQPYILFYNKYIPSWTLKEEQDAYYQALTSEGCPVGHVYSGIVELIKKLRDRRISMIVLSSDHPDTLLPEIKRFDLEDIFIEVITNVHDKMGKINELIKKNNFNPKETVFIGDSNHEVEVGKQAGIKTIAVTWGFCTEKKLKSVNPDYLVHNIKELGMILLS